MAKTQRKTIDKVFILLGIVMTAVLLIAGILACKASIYATSTVHDELASQKIFFPPSGSPAIASLPQSDQAAMNKYAGQQLVNGDQAKVYADNFIAVHLNEVADGQTYAQVSTKALANPSNTMLQQQVNTLFKGETLRGLLLGDGYSYWTIGKIAKDVSITAFAGAVLMAVLVLMGLRHLVRLK